MKEREQVAQEWQALSAKVSEEVLEWRKGHPQATLRAIEQELDKRLARLRAQMLEDAALMSERREWKDGAAGAPRCPECGRELKGRTREERQLQTEGEESIRLERQYGVCPPCGQGFFPPG